MGTDKPIKYWYNGLKVCSSRVIGHHLKDYVYNLRVPLAASTPPSVYCAYSLVEAVTHSSPGSSTVFKDNCILCLAASFNCSFSSLGLGLGLGLFYFLSYEWVSQICFKDQYTLWVHLTRPSKISTSRTHEVRKDRWCPWRFAIPECSVPELGPSHESTPYSR